MKNLEQQFSEDLSITPSSNSVRECSVSIPVDLLIDILSRVSVIKSIARFRCVSKFWSSILRCPYFTELFLTNSLTRPRFFFTFEVNNELVAFSSPQPQIPDDNSSLIATPYKYFPRYYSPTEIARTSAPLRGLVFLQRGKKVRVIYNPVTGESITLPKVKAAGIKGSYLGFDPISKQFKVLCLTRSRYGTPNTHRILTLETGKRLWRTIQDPILPHYVCSNDICINGVLYYYAAFQESSKKIVCFDFRFEKFSIIKLDEEMNPYWTLTLFNYKGKLGAHHYIDDQWGGRPREKFALWVLEDTRKHRWSKCICQLPPLWGNIANNNRFVGMTGTGEIVFSPGNLSNPLCIFYYNIERNTVTRINIQGFEAFEHHYTYVHTFLDYVENLKVM